MKTTPLTQKHIALGAKMVPFAGFTMPVEYTGITAEHHAVREKAGMFDVSHMGKFWIKGPGAFDLIQFLTSNDLTRLEIGQAQYSCLMNEQGGIVDDILVYAYEPMKYMLVVNASNTEKALQWISAHNSFGAVVEDATPNMTQLAVQGPLARPILQELTSYDLNQVAYYHFVTTSLAGIDQVIVSHTGYTGAGGFELYCNAGDAAKLWDAVMNAGQGRGLIPVGLGARDTLRLEMGFALYGNDIDDTTSPLEANLGWVTKPGETNKFLCADIILAQKAKGVSRKLIGFTMNEKAIPRKDYIIENQNGDAIGVVTSGTMSPTLRQGIGLGYVSASQSDAGNPLFIVIRDKRLRATVVKPPFVPYAARS